jgi:hypothetical protein
MSLNLREVSTFSIVEAAQRDNPVSRIAPPPPMRWYRMETLTL